MLSVVKAPSFIFKKKQQPNNFLGSYKVLKTMGVFHLSPLDFGLEPWHNERLCSSSIANVVSLYYVRICSTSSTWRGYSYPLNLWARLFTRSPKCFLGREWHLLHWELVSFNLIEFSFFTDKEGCSQKEEQGERLSLECLHLWVREMERSIPLQSHNLCWDNVCGKHRVFKTLITRP